MATITRENIGPLHEKVIVKLEKKDYLPSFERALKDYSKKANIPGFRKGMVPAGLIKKMYGSSLFADEVLRSVDRELIQYLDTDHLDIFAQPLPLETDFAQLDVNNPVDYTFNFEIGRKPEFELSDLGKAKIIRYVVDVTDEMVENEIDRLQNRYGNMKDVDAVDSEDNVINVQFTETDEAGNVLESGIKKDNSLLLKYFKEDTRKKLTGKKAGESVVIKLADAFDDKELEFISEDLGIDKNDSAALQKSFNVEITKVGLLEKKELNEEFFNQLYPGQNIATEADFKAKIKDEIAAQWKAEARNQIHDQLFHQLTDHTSIDFPQEFLKKWVKSQEGNKTGERVQTKTDEQIEKEFPAFLNQLKWTLITDKIIQENGLTVEADELRAFAKDQLMSYMGGMGAAAAEEQPWMTDYIERMMKDRKYVEDAYHRIQSQKVFDWAESKINPEEKPIAADDFRKLLEEHRHHHH